MSVLTDLYSQMIAKARSGVGTVGEGVRSKAQALRNILRPDGSEEDDGYEQMGQKLGQQLYNYFSGPSQNVEYGMGNYAPADVDQYYSDIGAMGDTGGSSGEGMGGGGNAVAALAYLYAALKYSRGMGGSGLSEDELGQDEIPWDKKSPSQKVMSVPALEAGAPGLTLLRQAINGNDYESGNFFNKLYNFMGESEYKAMKPLYQFFIQGPADIQGQSGNQMTWGSFNNWGD